MRHRLPDTRLADAAGPGDGHQPVLLHQPLHRLHVGLAAVQRRQLGRQVGRRARCERH